MCRNDFSKIIQDYFGGGRNDCGVGEEEQDLEMPLGGSARSRAPEGASGGSGVGVGQRLSQGATKPLNACNGIR